MIKVEPYWNVNSNFNLLCFVFNFIKVEPYWNVNYLIPPFYLIFNLH